MSRRRDLLTELGWVLVGSVALISALDALTLGGAFAEWITLLAAAVFIAAPLLALQRRRQRTQKEPATGPAGQDATPEDATPEDATPDPLALGPTRPALTWAAISVALLAALFPIGFHIWHGVIQGEQAHPAWSNYARWPIESEGRPADLRAPGVYAWTLGQDLFIWCERTPGVIIEMDSLYASALSISRTRGEVTVTTPTPPSPASPNKEPTALRCPPTRGGIDLTIDTYTIDLTTDDPTFPSLTLRAAAPLRIGPDPTPLTPDSAGSTTYTLAASAWWVLWLVLSQVLMVALPEEVFYRGYIQPTLKQALGSSQGGKGWRAMAALLVITSALFALGHVAVYWHWTRLMVFFPSLLFGWLRERTGGVLASTLFHAACNCAVELARVHYF